MSEKNDGTYDIGIEDSSGMTLAKYVGYTSLKQLIRITGLNINRF